MSGRVLPLILFLFIFISKTEAQNFLPGKIITLEKDTLSGWLKNITGRKASRLCVFKETPKGEKRSLTPEQLAGYKFDNGRYYISKQVDGKSFFLEYLVNGVANLYFLEDDGRQKYFIEKEGEKLVELSAPERVYSSDTGTYILPSLYKGKLIASFGEIDDITDRVSNIKLTHNALIDLARDYHDVVCDSVSCVIYEREESPIELSWSLHAGIMFKRLNLGYEIESNYQPSFSIGMHLYIHNLIFSDPRTYLSVEPGLNYIKRFDFKAIGFGEITYKGEFYRLTSDMEKVENFQGYANHLDVEIEMLNLQLPLLINYRLGLGKFRPYIGAGLNNIFLLSHNDDFEFHYFTPKFESGLPRYQLGYVLRTGMAFKSGDKELLNIQLTFESSENRSLQEYHRMLSRSLEISIGYIF